MKKKRIISKADIAPMCYPCRKKLRKIFVWINIKWESNNRTGRWVGENHIKMCPKCFKEFRRNNCFY